MPEVFRSTQMENALGGWSQALKLLLRRFFLHETSPAKGGITFTVSGETLTVYASVTDMISDGDGHRQGRRGAQTDLAARPLCSGLRGSTLRLLAAQPESVAAQRAVGGSSVAAQPL